MEYKFIEYNPQKNETNVVEITIRNGVEGISLFARNKKINFDWHCVLTLTKDGTLILHPMPSNLDFKLTVDGVIASYLIGRL